MAERELLSVVKTSCCADDGSVLLRYFDMFFENVSQDNMHFTTRNKVVRNCCRSSKNLLRHPHLAHNSRAKSQLEIYVCGECAYG